jgi:hypothetical protein
MLVHKTEILALLLSRGSEARAAWVDRQLPEVVDVDVNRSLLTMLDIDPATLTPVDQTEPRP